MQNDSAGTFEFLASVHPYDTLPPEELARVAAQFQRRDYAAEDRVYSHDETAEGLFLIRSGGVRVDGPEGEVVSQLKAKNSFGERGLMRDGRAATTATATETTTLLMLPAEAFNALMVAHPPFRDFFTRSRKARRREQPDSLANMRVDALMAADPVTCGPETSIVEAARLMRDRHISSLMVVEAGALVGLLTLRDMTNRALAEGLSPDRPVREIMTADPRTLSPDAIGSDVLHMMMELGIGHVPVADQGRPVGIVTQTNLTRVQAESSANLVGDIARADRIDQLAWATSRIPQLLLHLTGAGNRHDVVTRLITDIGDAVTRRLLALAEAKLGPPPVPYLWLACGSQGRREQTGVSDQDNCLMIDDAMGEGDADYFEALAQYVCDGLNACGYVYCPGEMMASNPRWRQPVSVWRGYFRRWINKPDPEAQMLASVMFDLRPIGGAARLFGDLQEETLALAAKNSIFVAHMVSNSLKHHPPLGLLRGFATLRSGEHKNQIDMKHNGVVPVVDLGRVYALRGRIAAANTRTRLVSAQRAGVVSDSGGRDLLDAYDLIAQTRIEAQARQIREGEKPDNYLTPSLLSEFERSHLRDAFVVVKTMQNAATQGQGVIS